MVSNFHSAIRGEKTPTAPFWFMRQAGRYLPEYRELRAKTKSFLTMCYTPDLAAEVTLQPLRRFDMDAAIIFSDILVIPHAMGVDVQFVAGEGPLLAPTRDARAVANLKTDIREHLTPVAGAIKLVQSVLPQGKALIGFCGAPWTVACYMIEGRNNGGWDEARTFAIREETIFTSLIEKLVKASYDYLVMQIEAGADVVQIFDSWAGVLSGEQYRKWVIAPTRRLVEMLYASHPHIPVIGFPRGSGVLYETYAEKTGVDAVGIDFQTPIEWAARHIPQAIQGNLDPLVLAYDKAKAVEDTKAILRATHDRPFIFNLGHGIIPQTPIDNVMAVCDTIRAGLA